MKVVLGRSGAGLNRNANGYTTWVGAKGTPHAAAQAEGGGATPCSKHAGVGPGPSVPGVLEK